MPDANSPDPIDPSFHDVFALFEGPLGEVTFPDVDSAAFAELADGVRQADDEVAQAVALLEASRAALHERRETLLARAKRALAYARIYAADKPDLAASIDRITLPRSGASTTPADDGPSSQVGTRKRGRPRKVQEADLLFGAPVEASAAE